ncbi:MAG: hypothetical protein M3Z85_01345 [Acidobacteriota bacterium]|nr:hypothetical protein [Acidobacteriota bacterium]
MISLPDNVFSDISAAILKFVTANGTFFQALGQREFYLVVALAIFIFGTETILAGFHQDRFVRLVFTILIVASLLSMYPSFYHLINNETTYLSTRLEAGQNEMLQQKLNQAAVGTEVPSIANVLGMFWYVVLILLIGAERFMCFAVIGFSYMAQAIAIILGPLFLPWAIVPSLEWLAQSWFRSFIQYSFYGVVASAMVYLNALVMLQFFGANPFPWEVNRLPVLVIQFSTIVGVCMYSLVHIPSLTNSLFTGRSGESLVRR